MRLRCFDQEQILPLTSPTASSTSHPFLQSAGQLQWIPQAESLYSNFPGHKLLQQGTAFGCHSDERARITMRSKVLVAKADGDGDGDGVRAPRKLFDLPSAEGPGAYYRGGHLEAEDTANVG